MPKNFLKIVSPELVFGIAGPIGVKIEELCESLSEALSTVGYSSHLVKITDEIAEKKSDAKKVRSKNFYDLMKYKIDHASALCREADDPALLMRYAIKGIQRERQISDAPELPIIGIEPVIDEKELLQRYYALKEEERRAIRQKLAYVVRQIKRPDEVHLMRTVYGRQFILISAYGSEEDRKRILEDKLRQTLPMSIDETEVARQVDDLLRRDMHEGDDQFGQHLRDSYYLADVFVDGIDKAQMDAGLLRFVRAYFGAADIAPSKAEFGLYLAGAASLRSSDLSRQVGAAVLTPNGEVLSQGCNEVPKAFGGTYWDEETPDFRDVKIGHDPNDQKKSEVLRDLLERLENAGLLSAKAKALGEDIHSLSEALTQKEIGDDGAGSLRDAVILDITEYGRVVHAEMNAILEAGRLGRSLNDGILYCTTFPCHNCTKHILAAGIKRVIYLEPYPKSKAKELHRNEVSIEREDAEKVVFIPFMGIAPGMLRHVFARGKRKEQGKAVRWLNSLGPVPTVDVMLPSYVLFETAAVADLS